MFYPGLVSISFRDHSPEEIISEAVKCRLDVWEKYLSELNCDHHLLLEFMPDDRMESLQDEADALHELIRKINNVKIPAPLRVLVS